MGLAYIVVIWLWGDSHSPIVSGLFGLSHNAHNAIVSGKTLDIYVIHHVETMKNQGSYSECMNAFNLDKAMLI